MDAAGKRGQKRHYTEDYFDPDWYEWEDPLSEASTVKPTTSSNRSTPATKAARTADATTCSSSAVNSTTSVGASSKTKSTGSTDGSSTKANSTASTVVSSTKTKSTASTDVSSTKANSTASTDVSSTKANSTASTKKSSSKANSTASTKKSSSKANSTHNHEPDGSLSLQKDDWSDVSAREDDHDDDADDMSARDRAIIEKLTKWGCFEKDWTTPTNLEDWLNAKDKAGIVFLNRLADKIDSGELTLEQVEEMLPGSTITNFYWSQKEQFESHRDKQVFLVLGHCPQYNVQFPTYPEEVAPEDSECLTSCVISTVSRLVPYPTITWDMRPDCRKEKRRKSAPIYTPYTSCRSISTKSYKTEYLQSLHLSNVLLKIARRFYNITVAATLSFTAAANHFVETIDSPHIRLHEHVSQMRDDVHLAEALMMGLVDAGLSSRSWRELHEVLRQDLLLAPGTEAGRKTVRLPSMLNATVALRSFEEIVKEADRFGFGYRAAYGQYGKPKSGTTNETDDMSEDDPVSEEPIAKEPRTRVRRSLRTRQQTLQDNLDNVPALQYKLVLARRLLGRVQKHRERGRTPHITDAQLDTVKKLHGEASVAFKTVVGWHTQYGSGQPVEGVSLNLPPGLDLPEAVLSPKYDEDDDEIDDSKGVLRGHRPVEFLERDRAEFFKNNDLSEHTEEYYRKKKNKANSDAKYAEKPKNGVSVEEQRRLRDVFNAANRAWYRKLAFDKKQAKEQASIDKGTVAEEEYDESDQQPVDASERESGQEDEVESDDVESDDVKSDDVESDDVESEWDADMSA
ncbi:hypothetical protein KCU67_g5640, partial [Aureobasidium melanogenum]